MTKLSRALQIFLWSYVVVYVVGCSLHISQIDLWWQLGEGEQILKSHALPTQPPAAYGFPADPYFDEYAGYEVLIAILFRFAGFPGLWLFFSAVYLAIIFLPSARQGQRYPAFDLASTVALLFAGIVLRERLEQRPEVVAALLLVLLMRVLRSLRLEAVTLRSSLPFFAIFFAWTNTHSTFLFGFFTLGLWMGCEVALKVNRFPLSSLLWRALLLGAVTMVATLLNPYGFERFRFPFLQAFDPESVALSLEMWPVTDFNSLSGVFIILAVSLLAWALFSSRNCPIWLVLFSVFSVAMAAWSYRCMGLPAIAVLFVYAARNGGTNRAARAPSPSALIVKNLVLSGLCLFMIFAGVFNFIFTFVEMRSEPHLAARTRSFAPEIVESGEAGPMGHIPILCGYGVGSYLSLNDNGYFRPLLDSGLGRFSDETKRYFFYVWHEPEAFALALGHLNVNYVLLDRETFVWIPRLHSTPGWRAVACTSNGMLWQRDLAAANSMAPPNLRRIEQGEQDLLQNGRTLAGFYYSTLLDKPGESLEILSHYRGRAWLDPDFNAICAWVDSQSTLVIRAFLDGEHDRNYPLVDALLAARLGPQEYEKTIKTLPPGPRPWWWELVRARELLVEKKEDEARKELRTISPLPLSSAAYYTLDDELKSREGIATQPGAELPGQWQSWNEERAQFVESMSERLSSRIAGMDRKSGQ